VHDLPARQTQRTEERKGGARKVEIE
jgi:hypothetical protein